MDKYLHKISNFLKSLLPTKRASNTFISSLDSILLQIRLISQESATSVLEIIKYLLSKYSCTLTRKQLSVISGLVVKLSSLIDYSVISPIIKKH